MSNYRPKQKTCWRCHGKKWFESAMGLIACQSCDGVGTCGVDVDWLIKDWRRLKELESKPDLSTDLKKNAQNQKPPQPVEVVVGLLGLEPRTKGL